MKAIDYSPSGSLCGWWDFRELCRFDDSSNQLTFLPIECLPLTCLVLAVDWEVTNQGCWQPSTSIAILWIIQQPFVSWSYRLITAQKGDCNNTNPNIIKINSTIRLFCNKHGFRYEPIPSTSTAILRTLPATVCEQIDQTGLYNCIERWL